MTDMGEVSFILGMKVTRDYEQGTSYISLVDFVNRILERFGMKDCNEVHTPGYGSELSNEQPEGYLLDHRSKYRRFVFSDGDIASPVYNRGFDPSLAYSTEKVVLFWQPPSYFSPWSPSLLVVDDVLYYCAEKYMMAEKASRFQDHRAVELIVSSPDLSTHKRIGRGVRNFDSAFRDREKKTPGYLAPTPNPRIIQP